MPSLNKVYPAVLSDVDRASAGMQKLRAHLLDQLENARIRNESPSADPVKTAMLRGEIRQIRYVLSLIDDPLLISVPAAR